MNPSVQNKSQRNALQQKYNAARVNLLLMLVLTVINIVLIFTDSDTMFLFSATFPYLSSLLGYMLSAELADNTYLIIGIVIAAVSLIIYLLCWIFSKNKYGWMIAALVLFGIDTMCMAGMYIIAQEVSGIWDVLIHIWVLYYLITGVYAGYKLKHLPEEVPISSDEFSAEEETADTAALRYADMTVKSRILLEADSHGKHICYRRIKRVNELVIGNYVYAEFEALAEPPHELTACLDGHMFSAGTDKASRAFISVDGEIIKSKLRLI